MRACLVLCVAAALIGAALSECTACIYGSCYQKHPLPVTEDLGWLMDIYRNKDILYTAEGYKLKQCLLEYKLCNTLAKTSNTQWVTVDQSTGQTYARLDNGTNYNIFKLDLVNNVNTFLLGEVFYMYFKDKLYYSPQFESGIYTYENGESRIVPGTEDYDVITFVVDKKDDIYFKIDDSLGIDYYVKWLSKGVVDKNVQWDGFYWMRTDKDGNAMFINKESRVVYRATDGQLVEVGVINDSIFHGDSFETPLFDKDNSIIYRYASKDYFYLKRNGGINCTYSISQNKTVITEVVVSKKLSDVIATIAL